MYRNTYVEVNLDNLGNNVKRIIKHYKDYKYYIGVVKGNAYGHGDYSVNTLIENGVNYLAVSTLEEALSIRTWNKDVPILCLVPVPIEYINVCIKNNITITVHDYFYFSELINLKLNGKLNIHLKIDTGMNRLGIKDKYEVKDIVDGIEENNNLFLEGIYTHFVSTGIEDEMWDNQLSTFEELTKLIDLKNIPIIHLGRSATLVNHEKISFANGIRMGIIMYGFNTLPSIDNSLKTKVKKNIKALIKKVTKKDKEISKTILECPVKLKTAFTLYSQVIQIKEVKKGDTIGYGGFYRFKKDSIVATIPIGYADGLNNRMNRSYVTINNNKYKIVGTINMGMITVLIDDKVNLYDKVIIFGENIKEVAHISGVTSYQLMTHINTNVPRVFIKDNNIKKIIEYR